MSPKRRSSPRLVVNPATGRKVNRARKVVNPVTGRMVRVGGRAYREALGLVKHRRASPASATRKVRRVVRKSPTKQKKSPTKRRKFGPVVTQVFTLAPGVRV